jgi:hypothetical protein
MGATERIVVLVTPEQKAEISSRAKEAKLTVGELLRRAAAAYTMDEQDEALAGLVEQVRKSAAQASKALDDALRQVSASQRRIAAMEKAHARVQAKRVA